VPRWSRATFREPVVTYKDAVITGLGISGGSLEVLLSIYNPNSFRLDGTGITYRLNVDSVPFGNGTLSERFTVQEGDSTTVRLPLSFTYAGVGQAGRQLIQTGSVNTPSVERSRWGRRLAPSHGLIPARAD
jgi:LEA14-like dessication related protein